MTTDHSTTAAVLAEVREERTRQDQKWGVQHLPFHARYDGRGVALTGRSYAVWAAMYQAQCDRRHAAVDAGGADHRSNALVLLEEVFEALAETDPAKIRTELIQVAAVAVKSVEEIDRRTRGITDIMGRWNVPDWVREEVVRLTAAHGAEMSFVRLSDGLGCSPGGDGLAPRERHPYNGADRLHGLCRCGEGPDAEIHNGSGE